MLAALAAALSLGTGCETPAAANGGAGTPKPVLLGPRTKPPAHPYPTQARFPDTYAHTWDAVCAVLASRGFPMVTVARNSGVITTGWRVTEPNHEADIGGRDFVGRKVERLTLLVRPLSSGTAVAASSQTALVSPEWSAAGTPPAGQAADLPSDTVTEYGVLADVGRILGHPLPEAPDPAYAAGLGRGGVFAAAVKGQTRRAAPAPRERPHQHTAQKPVAPAGEPGTAPALSPPPVPVTDPGSGGGR